MIPAEAGWHKARAAIGGTSETWPFSAFCSFISLATNHEFLTTTSWNANWDYCIILNLSSPQKNIRSVKIISKNVAVGGRLLLRTRWSRGRVEGRRLSLASLMQCVWGSRHGFNPVCQQNGVLFFQFFLSSVMRSRLQLLIGWCRLKHNSTFRPRLVTKLTLWLAVLIRGQQKTYQWNISTTWIHSGTALLRFCITLFYHQRFLYFYHPSLVHLWWPVRISDLGVFLYEDGACSFVNIRVSPVNSCSRLRLLGHFCSWLSWSAAFDISERNLLAC